MGKSINAIVFGSGDVTPDPFIDVFDNVFTNTSNYGDRAGYTIRTTSSRYSFMYAGVSMQIKGKTTISGTFWNFLEIFINDVYYQSVQVNDDNYINVPLPWGNKKISILTGITSHPNNTGDIVGTFLTGLIVDRFLYSKINTQENAAEYVFLGDSITVGDHAFTSINGYANLFYKKDKLSTTVLGWGWGRLFDFAGDTTKINDTVARILEALKTSTTRKLIIALGTNDYGIDVRPANDFISYARNMINAIILADPTIEILWNEPLYRNGESTLLQSYRDGLVSLAAELGTFAVVPCKNVCTYPDDYADPIHPNTVGHDKYYTFVKPYYT